MISVYLLLDYFSAFNIPNSRSSLTTSPNIPSTIGKVLQSDAESTPVLSGKYWSTDRTVLGLSPLF